ncbi:helix-turn-helix domain-containing protein [Saccharopolyspora taberi]|uniref:TetR/AcrR family transcriptional regulator n=1 Tax=Saccharopolyspora taberi TaxID=60895 RepID=A0ABN3VEC2_9PSEU
MPKIIGSSLEEHREQMHDRIFSALARLAEERGYAALTLADVAARAGVSRTAMYNYFKDKETLLLAHAHHETQRYVDRLVRDLAARSDPVDQLRAFIRMQLTELATQHLSAGALSGVLSEAGRRQMYEHVAPLWDQLRDILERAMRERYLPREDLDVLMPVLAGTISQRAAGLAGQRLERAIEVTTAFVLRGLGARLDRDGRPRRLPAS